MKVRIGVSARINERRTLRLLGFLAWVGTDSMFSKTRFDGFRNRDDVTIFRSSMSALRCSIGGSVVVGGEPGDEGGSERVGSSVSRVLMLPPLECGSLKRKPIPSSCGAHGSKKLTDPISQASESEDVEVENPMGSCSVLASELLDKSMKGNGLKSGA
jgi:hypothetical protein